MRNAARGETAELRALQMSRPFIAAMLSLMVGLSASPMAKDKKSEEARISVVVLAGGSSTEFTDPSEDREHSAKDIMDALSGSKVVRTVRSEADAVIVIEVLARESKDRVSAFSGVYGRKSESTVHVRLTAGGEFSTEFEGSGGGNGVLTDYRGAAKRIAKQVNDWVEANSAKLSTLKPAWRPASK
jgi:hypothetical protein